MKTTTPPQHRWGGVNIYPTANWTGAIEVFWHRVSCVVHLYFSANAAERSSRWVDTSDWVISEQLQLVPVLVKEEKPLLSPTYNLLTQRRICCLSGRPAQVCNSIFTAPCRSRLVCMCVHGQRSNQHNLLGLQVCVFSGLGGQSPFVIEENLDEHKRCCSFFSY